jgi:hypothetical protein
MDVSTRLVLPGSLTSAASGTSGLLLPRGALQADEPEELSFVHTIVTWEELTGSKLREAQIVDRLAKISAYDCLQALGRVSCMVHAGPLTSLSKHRLIMDRLGWPDQAKTLLEGKLTEEGANGRALFFPQQLVHLARLAVLHCDQRDPDDFEGGAQTGAFIECLLGVSDLFEEGPLDEHDPSSTIPWVLRQLAINGRHDSTLLWGRYYDILIRTWQEVATPEAFDAADAFRRYTGLTMADWLTIGFAFYSRYFAYGDGHNEEYFVDPDPYLSEAAVGQELWGPFLARNAQTLEECRAALREEEEEYGSTQYRAQTFEKRPLLWFPDGRVIPLALDSLERRCTEGMFFELADGAQAEGLRRDAFTGPFGAVFEEFVQRAWERMMPSLGVPRIHRPKTYKRGSENVESTDAVLDASAEGVVFCEIVSRRPRVATLTRGDWTSFLADLETGPLRKARQLDLNIKDYRSGVLKFDQLEYEEGQAIWPMLVLTEGFPTMPPIPQFIAQQIDQRGWLRGLPALAIVGSEDLALLEGLLGAGFGTHELLSLWKGNPSTVNLPFSNFVSTLQDPRVGLAREPRFYSETWDELTGLIRQRLFPETQ